METPRSAIKRLCLEDTSNRSCIRADGYCESIRSPAVGDRGGATAHGSAGGPADVGELVVIGGNDLGDGLRGEGAGTCHEWGTSVAFGTIAGLQTTTIKSFFGVGENRSRPT